MVVSDLQGRIAAMVPGLLQPEGVSRLRIRTTQPVLLLFNRGADAPACVAQRGRRTELSVAHDVMRRLRSSDPTLVAEPLGLLEDGSGSAWGIIRGLPGWPWFTLPHHYPGPAGLATVTGIALATLRRFTAAVSVYDDWRLSEPLPDCLDRELDGVCATHEDIAAAIDSGTRARWRGALERVEPARWHRQHGDFCVNNLLLDDGSASIVDFEEFGLANAPLHDAFSLAFSLHEFAERSGVGLALDRVIAQCVSDDPLTGDLAHETRSALLVHHLCWRINQCATRPTRREIAARLADFLRMVIDGRLAAG